MKSLLTFLLLSIGFISASAKEPVIALSQAFDGRYNDKEGVSISISRSPGNYYYSIKTGENMEVSRQLKEWVAQDIKKATSTVENIHDGKRSLIISIQLDNTVNIGVKYFKDDEAPASVWLQSAEPLLE